MGVTLQARPSASTRQRAYAVGLRAYRHYRWFSSPERMRMRGAVRRWVRSCDMSGVLLEVGGGTSMLRTVIEREAPGVHYVSGDIAPTDATHVVLDAACAPIRDESVDAVLALEVLEHLDDPRKMIFELGRVLAPDGVLIVTVPFMYGVHDYRDYFRFTPLGFETLLAGSGLELQETDRRGGSFVAAAGLVKTMIRNKILGDPGDWRAKGARKKVLWLIVLVVELPWVPIMWLAMCMDRVFDPASKSPPGYFFLCRKTRTVA
jgi:SAM-dependent methyltransferase